MDYYFGNPNPFPNCARSAVNMGQSSPDQFILSDYLTLDDYGVNNQECWSHSTESSKATSDASGATSKNFYNIKCKDRVKQNKVEVSQRIAFRTRSEVEIMDDGYKWRKYGKKSVKSSPNPRNYYKCSSGGCKVKKRVERDKDDSSYVITSYEGMHNHESPCAAYYSHKSSLALPQPSANSSSSKNITPRIC